MTYLPRCKADLNDFCRYNARDKVAENLPDDANPNKVTEVLQNLNLWELAKEVLNESAWVEDSKVALSVITFSDKDEVENAQRDLNNSDSFWTPLDIYPAAKVLARDILFYNLFHEIKRVVRNEIQILEGRLDTSKTAEEAAGA